MEAASGEQIWKPPEDEDEEVALVGYVVLFCLLGLVCLASYVLWRLHRKRSDGLEGPAHVESSGQPVRHALTLKAASSNRSQEPTKSTLRKIVAEVCASTLLSTYRIILAVLRVCNDLRERWRGHGGYG